MTYTECWRASEYLLVVKGTDGKVISKHRGEHCVCVCERERPFKSELGKANPSIYIAIFSIHTLCLAALDSGGGGSRAAYRAQPRDCTALSLSRVAHPPPPTYASQIIRGSSATTRHCQLQMCAFFFFFLAIFTD